MKTNEVKTPTENNQIQAKQINSSRSAVTVNGARYGYAIGQQIQLLQSGRLAPVQMQEVMLNLQRTIGNRAVVQLMSQQQQTAAVHEHAASGVQGAGSRLPHHDKIQAAFGSHDISHVRSHTGVQAQAATQAIGAEAYTTGNQIAFASSTPSLHTTAHEAAHVVQQQHGVQLKGGVGEVGDQYEQQADAVADAVVQGKSAESLLEQAGHSASSPKEDRQDVQNKAVTTNQVQLRTVPRPPDPTGQPTDIDVGKTAAQEMVPKNAGGYTLLNDYKTTELSALLMPDVNLHPLGHPTKQGVNPMGWSWIERTEKLPSSTGGNPKIKYWVRFHLLNAEIGGDGWNELHLTPTRKTTNSQWESDIEHDMKETIKGKGTFQNPAGFPIYYKVTLNYWQQTDAPASYDTSTTSGGADYSPNITLFPKDITADWYLYDKGWKKQISAKTGDILPKPAGLGGGKTLELTSSSSVQIAKDLSIPEEVVTYLKDYYQNVTAPKHYSEVRGALDKWLIKAKPQNFEKISGYIYDADSNLRSALAGTGLNALTIKNNKVSDDGVMEARLLNKPVGKNEDPSSYADQFKGVAGAISGGYQQALKYENSSLPKAEVVMREIILFHLNSKSLADVQTNWNNFVTANTNVTGITKLPAMIGDAFAREGEEVIQTVYKMTFNPLISYIESFFKIHEILNIYTAELLQEIKQVYWNVLKNGNGQNLSIKAIRNAYQDSNSEDLLMFLVKENQIVNEFYWRKEYIRSAVYKGIDVNSLFEDEGKAINPNTLSLNTPFVKVIELNFHERNRMKKQEQEQEKIHLEKERLRQQPKMQRPLELPSRQQTVLGERSQVKIEREERIPWGKQEVREGQEPLENKKRDIRSTSESNPGYKSKKKRENEIELPSQENVKKLNKKINEDRQELGIKINEINPQKFELFRADVREYVNPILGQLHLDGGIRDSEIDAYYEQMKLIIHGIAEKYL